MLLEVEDLRPLRIKKRNIPLHLMILPALAIVIIYQYGPMLGIVMAFQRIRPNRFIFNAEWVGLANFRYLFSLPTTMQVIWNTLVIAFFKIVTLRIAAISLAILLNEVKNPLYKRTVQTVVYIPHFLSWVILGGILIEILSPSEGIVNAVIKALGFKPIFFLASNTWFRPTMVISHLWKETGWATIIYLAAITNIDPMYYEAAFIDGAGRWKQIKYVTLPGMMPVIILTVVLSMDDLLSAGFDQIFNLYNPLVYQTGDVLDTAIYRLGLVQHQYSVATAFGLFKSVISFILISSAYYLAYKIADYRIF
jgi:putative aldouronate transport system permease protein